MLKAINSKPGVSTTPNSRMLLIARPTQSSHLGKSIEEWGAGAYAHAP